MLCSRQSLINRKLAKWVPTLLVLILTVNYSYAQGAGDSPPKTDVAAEPAADSDASAGQSWINLGITAVVGCSVLTAGIVLVRSRRRHKPAQALHPAPTHKSEETHSAGSGNGSPKTPSLHPHKIRARVANSSRQSGPVLKPRLNGSARPTNGHRRKRAFDYNRYFADLMSSVSSYSSVEHSLATPTAQTQEIPAKDLSTQAAPPLLDANAQMIANQKNLIEDQRRLIQEQTRLIEEKTRLISEKNHLLKIQAEMIGDKIL